MNSKLKIALFWLLSCTWGIIMTLIGAIAALALIITKHKPKIFHGLVYFEVGYNWGGVNLGAFFIVSNGQPLQTKQHEAGHGLQNIMLGIFMPIIGIMSATRYWYREWKINHGKGSELRPYDAAWYEGWATKLGKKYFA